jgi:hypothetical protein
MNAEKSLRLLVEKWLTISDSSSIRVTKFGRIHPRGVRYVCVEVARTKSSIKIFFFRHDDGSWCVFPPERRRLSIRAYEGCA